MKYICNDLRNRMDIYGIACEDSKFTFTYTSSVFFLLLTNWTLAFKSVILAHERNNKGVQPSHLENYAVKVRKTRDSGYWEPCTIIARILPTEWFQTTERLRATSPMKLWLCFSCLRV